VVDAAEVEGNAACIGGGVDEAGTAGFAGVMVAAVVEGEAQRGDWAFLVKGDPRDVRVVGDDVGYVAGVVDADLRHGG